MVDNSGETEKNLDCKLLQSRFGLLLCWWFVQRDSLWWVLSIATTLVHQHADFHPVYDG